MSAELIVDRRENLDAEEFREHYVKRRRPVLVKNALAGSSALSLWDFDYLRREAGASVVPLKTLSESEIKISHQRLSDYLSDLETFERRGTLAGSNAPPPPAYLHDIPLTALLPGAQEELAGFPKDYFPAWYRSRWPQFAQAFVGPTGSLTPLHFDCLLTHNLFFQVRGRKRFVLMAAEQIKYCYRHHWRWCEVDVEAPDLERFPLYREARPAEVVVEPGDCLYFPPGTLHHVRSLDAALSFNIDWHTKDSAADGVLAGLRGMPLRNVYYNAVIALGLWTGVSVETLYPYYRSYLTYVS
ncbi:MAG TPA: cupin-like domain-containing protein [Methylocystis sp.]|nr:cupin-like domain-containing protein [Methylocystis sp.]